VVVHARNPSTWEDWEFEATLGYKIKLKSDVGNFFVSKKQKRKRQMYREDKTLVVCTYCMYV
jgi:hypothetical protein